MAKYNDLFPSDAATYQYGFTRLEKLSPCEMCKEITTWWNHDFKAYLCSQECELAYFENELKDPVFNIKKIISNPDEFLC